MDASGKLNKGSEAFIQGSKYRLVMKNGEVHEGVFVFETNSFIYLKLESGYNIGISSAGIETFSEIAKKDVLDDEQDNKPNKEKKEEQKEKLNEERNEERRKEQKEELVDEHDIKIKKCSKPEILVLHTGGTIASRVDYSTGAVSAKFTTDDLLTLFPELVDIATIDSKFVSNMLSENINFVHYNKMAQVIVDALKDNKNLAGIILAHGTDTLHYTAAALSFILENIRVPVIIVGAQRSSDRPSSDAALNILSAAIFISKSKERSKEQKNEHNLGGVFVCMHEGTSDDNCLILPGVNTIKMHSSRRDAFKAINSSPIARVNVGMRTVDILRENSQNNEKHKAASDEKSTTENVDVKFFNSKLKIGILRSRPSMFSDEIAFFKHYDGLILEGTGLGHFPIESFDENTQENVEIFRELKNLAKEKIVCMTTQTTSGRVNMNVYSPGRALKDAGVLGHNLNITTETAYIKLAWLLSNYIANDAKRLYSEILRGEITKRSEKEDFS